MPVFLVSLALLGANPISRLLLQTTPGVAVLGASVGIVLLFVELNRPGVILPGFVGLLLVLLAVATLARFSLQPWALVLVSLASVTLACNLWKRLPAILLVAAGVALAVGLHSLVSATGAPSVRWPVALVCGGGLALAAALLSRVAFRARRLKAVH